MKNYPSSLEGYLVAFPVISVITTCFICISNSLESAANLFSRLGRSPFSYRNHHGKLSKEVVFATFTLLLSLLFLAPTSSNAQAAMTSTGNWNQTARWSGGNIGDAVSETVTLNNNVSGTVLNGYTYTVGNTTLAQNNTLTVNSGGTLNIGNASNSRALVTNNNANISVAGTLVIWGDLEVNNNLVWTISGTVIIKGSVKLKTNSNISVSGNLIIDGDFTGNNNNNVNVSGSVTVGGNINIGNGSNLNGCNKCFKVKGTCSGPASFCNSGALPIVLLSLHAHSNGDNVALDWSTASEKNFDKFIIEHSIDGIKFDSIGFIVGAGESKQVLNYSFNHSSPILGKNYYRLKSVDFDLTYEHSPLVAATFAGSRTVIVYSDPANRNQMAIRTNFKPEEGDRVLIYDNMGLKLSDSEVVKNNSSFEVGNLKQGTYLMKYVSSNFSQTVRFSVVRANN